jgi:hypothetical protein
MVRTKSKEEGQKEREGEEGRGGAFQDSQSLSLFTVTP